MLRPASLAAICGLFLFVVPTSFAQSEQGSRNVSLVHHVPLGVGGNVGSVALSQQGDEAYAVVGSSVELIHTDTGRRERTLLTLDATIQSLSPAGPAGVLAAASNGVWLIELRSGESRSISLEPSRDVFGYRHSGNVTLAISAAAAGVQLIGLDGTHHGMIEVPQDIPGRDRGFEGVFAAYDLASETDRLYAAGAGGYFVFDITDPSSPSLLTHINSAAVQYGVSAQAIPDASHLVTTTNYRTAPIRIFDIRPALDGTISQVRTAVGAWTADWRGHSEHLEVRWPYVFVAAGDQGFQMFNMRNAFEPFTTAWFKTAHVGGSGAVDVDVRNRDGLVAVTDVDTGLWLIRVEDFRRWDGRGWGQGNISSVQDWDSGPVNSDRW